MEENPEPPRQPKWALEPPAPAGTVAVDLLGSEVGAAFEVAVAPVDVYRPQRVLLVREPRAWIGLDGPPGRRRRVDVPGHLPEGAVGIEVHRVDAGVTDVARRLPCNDPRYVAVVTPASGELGDECPVGRAVNDRRTTRPWLASARDRRRYSHRQRYDRR